MAGDGYNGYIIEPGSKQKLMTLFPPAYDRVMGHHITERFGVEKGDVPEEPRTVEVVGYINDGEAVEGLLIAINGSTERPSGGKYHITWSLGRYQPEGGEELGKMAKPFHTNAHTDNAQKIKRPIPIDVEPRFFPHGS